MNRKFSRPSRSGDDSHVNLGKVKINGILCMEFDRIISKNYIIRFETRLFQIIDTNKTLPRTKDKALVRVKLGRSIQILRCDRQDLI